MEGFDEGKSRTEVLAEAARRYREVWGSDKVIDFSKTVESVSRPKLEPSPVTS